MYDLQNMEAWHRTRSSHSASQHCLAVLHWPPGAVEPQRGPGSPFASEGWVQGVVWVVFASSLRDRDPAAYVRMNCSSIRTVELTDPGKQGKFPMPAHLLHELLQKGCLRLPKKKKLACKSRASAGWGTSRYCSWQNSSSPVTWMVAFSLRHPTAPEAQRGFSSQNSRSLLVKLGVCDTAQDVTTWVTLSSCSGRQHLCCWHMPRQLR